MAYRGHIPTDNEMNFFVVDFFNRKLLTDLGYQMPIYDLDEIDIQIFTVIANEYNKLERDEIKKSRKK